MTINQKFTASIPSYPGLFVSAESAAALDRTVVVHLLRTGQFETAETFIAVCTPSISTSQQAELCTGIGLPNNGRTPVEIH